MLYPGEFVEIASDSLSAYEGDVAIEPRVDSPMQGTWPSPTISRVIQGTIRIPNDTDEPIHLPKSKHFAQIRRVTSPSVVDMSITQPQIGPVVPPNQGKISHSSSVLIDPDNQLTPAERERFQELLVTYDNVFNKAFGAYNGASGPYKASLNLGPAKPPSTKPQLPFYPQASLVLLQEEADKLEVLGVLRRPEDMGIEVKFTSPSFLIRKPDSTYRFITAFNELGLYTNVLPTASPTCNDVLRKLSSFKYLIKSDLTKSFFQIPLTKDSMQYLGTVTPFKGIRVYTRSAMGMPGSSEHLRELMTRVLGEYFGEGFVIAKDDDLYIGADSVLELLCNWQKVLHRLQLNNLYLSASKTVIAPKKTTVLGWNWNSGTISAPSHKITPLASSDPPKTCTAMRSFIGAYKALSRCIPRYSSLISPLENCIKGLQGNSCIQWDPDLTHHFRKAQDALKSPKVLTIPVKSDKLTMTVDASPVNDGISATLFVSRDTKQLVAEHFSLKLKSHQTNWQPCELEALAITAAVKHFSPYVRESLHPLLIFTDNKPCVQAHNKLLKGHFSASARLSTFLSCLSEYNVKLSHIKGTDNVISDYGSRNPQECKDKLCQICKFVEDTCSSVVRAVNVSDVLSGSARMPFLNEQAWRAAQQECHELRRAFAHLRAGTRPSRKSKGMRNVKRYLNLASINGNGVLVVCKPDPYFHQRKLTIVPKDILPGIVNALHLHFTHCCESQLKKLFNRYFYCIGSEAVIKSVVEACHQCASLRKVPKEIFDQSSSASPTSIGQQFAADVIKRQSQCIFALRDIHSSFTTAQIISDEKAPSLRSALLTSSSFLRAPTCEVRVDNAPGFLCLREDSMLVSQGIALDYGRVKNVNKNPCAEKCNQELELELLKVDSSGSPVSDSTLQAAIQVLNSRIRNRGLSAKEIVTCRDQVTHKILEIDDELLSKQQEAIREKNHPSSAKSKAPNASPAADPNITPGSLVFIKSEGDKFHPRELYIVVSIADGVATVQKFPGQSFMSKKYTLPTNRLYAMTPNSTELTNNDSSSSDDDDSVLSSSSSSDGEEEVNTPASSTDGLRRSSRQRQQPRWLASGEWVT